MVEIKKNNAIAMTRGDTLVTRVSILDMDGNEYVPVETDKIRFALKRSYNDSEVLIYKEIPYDTMILRVDSEDTKELQQPGVYVYDIQITFTDGTVSTFISGKLKLVEEVE